MPIYILKRYHKVGLSEGDGWNLARECAFHAGSDQTAITQVQKQCTTDLLARCELAILIDPRGRRLWECLIEEPITGPPAILRRTLDAPH